MDNWILICLAIYAVSIVGMIALMVLGLKAKSIEIDNEFEATFMASITLLPIANTIGVIYFLAKLSVWILFKKLGNMYLRIRDNNI